eukprot:scaffold62280_cov22-Tisochrysis_lutea.AAC.2
MNLVITATATTIVTSSPASNKGDTPISGACRQDTVGACICVHTAVTRTMASKAPIAWPRANPKLVSATQESFQMAWATRVGFTRSSAR